MLNSEYLKKAITTMITKNGNAKRNASILLAQLLIKALLIAKVIQTHNARIISWTIETETGQTWIFIANHQSGIFLGKKTFIETHQQIK